MPAATGKRFTKRMKKSLLLLLLLLLPLVTMTAFGQESRQDISVSGSALFPPASSAGAPIFNPIRV